MHTPRQSQRVLLLFHRSPPPHGHAPLLSGIASPCVFQRLIFPPRFPHHRVSQRHGLRDKKLNRPADQRKAMLRSLTTELIRHGRIQTTLAKAKVVRKTADHMVTLAKDGSLHARRQALGYLYDKELVHALFEQAPERYADRNGGYTRVLRDGYRRGDNSEMGVIELL